MDGNTDTMPRPEILIVDDKPENLYSLEKLLRRLDVEVVQASSGMEALGLVLDHEFFCAVIDVQMPEMDGYELVELLRGNESTALLPVIFVSAIFSDEYHHRRAYDAGAVDFISKPFVPEILLSKIRVFLELYSRQNQLREVVTRFDQANQALSRHALQLQIGAQVSGQITSILSLDTLLDEVARLIQTRFDYYFVGIWLLDETREHVVLMVGQGKDLSRGLPLGYPLAVDSPVGIISWVCRHTRSYLANDVRQDKLFMPTDNLPDTAAELTLPLLFSDQLLGVLDIQSDEIQIFNDEDQAVFLNLAGQIAVAIRNAQLYAEVTQFSHSLEAKVRERTAELETAYERLEMLDRNKSNFIAVVSHELRTPLTLVKGFSHMMLKGSCVQNDPVTRQQVEGIVSGAERMHEIVNSMLDMVKIDSSTLELSLSMVAIEPLFKALIKNLGVVLVERNQTLEMADLTPLAEIQADREALRKVFDHLLHNAIKYTPDGGRITVSGRRLSMKESGPVSSEFVEVIIADTGIGVAREVQELIFTKFYRVGDVALHSSGKTKFMGGGPGLGLAIARGIVQAHGGRIWVESSGYDETTFPGSQFHVLLPVTASGNRL